MLHLGPNFEVRIRELGEVSDPFEMGMEVPYDGRVLRVSPPSNGGPLNIPSHAPNGMPILISSPSLPLTASEIIQS